MNHRIQDLLITKDVLEKKIISRLNRDSLNKREIQELLQEFIDYKNCFQQLL